jgi:Mce-associated membrane protein
MRTAPSSTADSEASEDSPAADLNSSEDTAGTIGTGSDTVDYEDTGADHADSASWSRILVRPQRLAVLIGLLMALALAALVGWLGLRSYEYHQSEDLRALYLQVGRQGALDLTTIDWQHADADVERILTAATGTFYDDFSKRSQPFIDVVKKAQSTSVGNVTAAGLESSTDSDAQVLVAVSVQTTNGGAPQQTPRAWRMRISVHKVGNDVKVSNVEFVP